MTMSRTEFPEPNPFAPKEISNGLYRAESYTADGEKIDLYMELITEDKVNTWQAYPIRASKIAEALRQGFEPNSSKFKALTEVPRGAFARGFFKGDYVVYALKDGTESPFLKATTNEQDARKEANRPNNEEKFKQDYGNVLMSLIAECTPKEVCWGIMNEFSYTNRGIFRNPLSIIEGKHKGLAMLLHGFSAAVAQDFFNKKFMEVSPIASMQKIVYDSLPREAFDMTDEDYEIIKEASKSMSGKETINNVIKIESLSNLYLETSSQNANKANTRVYRQSAMQDRIATTENETDIKSPDKSSDFNI